MAERTSSRRENASPNGSSEGPKVSALREELASSREEVLRLRDLLIGKDAEVEAIRSRLGELEGGSTRVAGLAARLRGRLVGLAWRVAAWLRRLRGPQA